MGLCFTWMPAHPSVANASASPLGKPPGANVTVTLRGASEVLVSRTSKTAAGVLHSAESPRMKGLKARSSTLTGASSS